MRHSDARGLGAITSDALKSRKVIEFEILYVPIFFSCIYLKIDEKRSFIN